MPPKTKQKPQKPNEQCACGSGKKYKKCCSFALAVANAKPATRKAWAWRGDPEDANRLDQRIKHGAALRDSGNLQSGKTVLEAAVAYAKEIGHTQGQSAALTSNLSLTLAAGETRSSRYGSGTRKPRRPTSPV